MKNSDDKKQTINKQSTEAYYANVQGTFGIGKTDAIAQDWNATCPDGSSTAGADAFFYLSVDATLSFSYSLRVQEKESMNAFLIKVYCNGTGLIQTQ